jgi:hypothetical protein
LQDCNGEWGGGAEFDACGQCEGNVINENDCEINVTDIDGNVFECVYRLPPLDSLPSKAGNLYTHSHTHYHQYQ